MNQSFFAAGAGAELVSLDLEPEDFDSEDFESDDLDSEDFESEDLESDEEELAALSFDLSPDFSPCLSLDPPFSDLPAPALA